MESGTNNKVSDQPVVSSLERISAEELTELKLDLEKKKSDMAVVIGILKLLQKKLITFDLLRQTMIGKTLTSLKKTTAANASQEEEAKQVRSLSEKLISMWKTLSKDDRDMEKMKNKSGSNGNGNGT